MVASYMFAATRRGGGVEREREREREGERKAEQSRKSEPM